MWHLIAQISNPTVGDTINYTGLGTAGVTVGILWTLLLKERARADKATEQSITTLERVLPLLTSSTNVIDAASQARQETQLARLEATIARLGGKADG